MYNCYCLKKQTVSCFIWIAWTSLVKEGVVRVNPTVEMYFQKLNRKLINNWFPLSSAIKKMKYHKRAEGKRTPKYKSTNELNESKNQQPSAQRTEKKRPNHWFSTAYWSLTGSRRSLLLHATCDSWESIRAAGRKPSLLIDYWSEQRGRSGQRHGSPAASHHRNHMYGKLCSSHRSHHNTSIWSGGKWSLFTWRSKASHEKHLVWNISSKLCQLEPLG